MAFNYQKNKEHGSGDSFWTSYSDLFLGLSSIFLLLYVTASLRTSTDSIKAHMDNQKLSMQVQDLKNQLKMYESIKKDYLEKSASDQEMREYQELMDKLSLLQEEAKDEKEKLRRQAMANEAKEGALNKYQQMIRNVINANKLAKTKIINREDIITEQDEEIDTQEQQLTQMQAEVRKREQLIQDGERKIAEANKILERKMADLNRARKQNQITAKAYEKRLAQIQAENESKVDALRDANAQYQRQIKKTKGDLARMGGELDRLGSELSTNKGLLAKKEGEVLGLKGELAKAQAERDMRRAIAREIRAGFAKKGIKADVDEQTGDVLIDFGNHYFDSDSAKLKPEMMKIIEEAMPVYSKSLFGNPKVAKQISAVEVIGFASPIYRGKFVDPDSTSPADRQALKYNMDLSYRRARSIFEYILDEKSMEFEYQQDLLPLLKVSGRSFLEIAKKQRGVASAEEFCKLNDCRKAQRVIIRFNVNGQR